MLVNAVSGAFGKTIDFVGNALKSIANLTFVASILVGFSMLPRQLMLVISVVGIFAGPWLIENFFDLLYGAVYVSMNTPAIAVGVIFLFAFVTSKVFQRITLYLGLDKNQDGKVGWRDLLLWLISITSEKAGPITTAILGDSLTELKTGVQDGMKAVKQNAEILKRMDTIEAKLSEISAALQIPEAAATKMPKAAAAHGTAPASYAPLAEEA